MTINASLPNKSLLTIEHLKTYYHHREYGTVRAVDDVNICINRNEVVGLVGESGSGKSTIGLSILQLLSRSGEIIDGRIIFKGRNLVELSKEEMRRIRGKEIAIIFQEPMTYLNPVFKIKDQIGEVVSLSNGRGKHIEEKVMKLMKEVRIASPEIIQNYYPHQLSGGMLQRVMIAMALAQNPDILIADEPTTALDVTIQAQILDLIRDLIQRKKSSVLLITHDLGIIAELCDSIYTMYAGKVAEYGNVFDIFDSPKHPYTAGLLESTLSINKFKKELVGIKGNVPNLVNPPMGCRFHPRCSYAMSICAKENPELIDVGNRHYVACHLVK